MRSNHASIRARKQRCMIVSAIADNLMCTHDALASYKINGGQQEFTPKTNFTACYRSIEHEDACAELPADYQTSNLSVRHIHSVIRLDPTYVLAVHNPEHAY